MGEEVGEARSGGLMRIRCCRVCSYDFRLVIRELG